MTKVLTINANIAADYQIIDATGYDTVHLTNVADSDFVNLSENDRYKIVDGNNGDKEFQIKVDLNGDGSAYKYINLLNYAGLTTIVTDTDTQYNLTGVSNMSNPITSGINNNFVGTALSDKIDATNADQVYTPWTHKVKKKWRTDYIATGIGVNVDAGKGNDTIQGSRYADTITGGEGTNTILLSTKQPFGDDIYYQTKGEVLLVKLFDRTASGSYNLEKAENNLVITVKDSGAKMGSLTIVDYFTEMQISAASKILDADNTIMYQLSNYHPDTSKTYDGDNGNYVGTRFNDIVDATDATQVMGARTYKNKKVKKLPLGMFRQVLA